MNEAEDMRLWAGFLRVSQASLGAVEADLKTGGFPPLAWYDALLELDRTGIEGLRQFELGQRMLLAQYNLSRLIDRLARAGYVVCQQCPEDGRGQVIRITEAGRALLARMWPVYRDAVARHFDGRLDRAAREGLSRAVARLTAPVTGTNGAHEDRDQPSE